MGSKLKTAFKLVKGNRAIIPYAIFRNITKLGLTRIIPDELYLKIAYKLATGHKANLNNPQTFNEKLQWLKLHDRNPQYTIYVDKYKVREYIANTIGKEYLIPLLGVWENANDINFDNLPNQFVLKCNHDSGSVIICKNKKELNKKQTIKKLNKALKNTGYWFGREWPYKNVRPCIIAEKYMEDKETGELVDFKVHNFNGIPKVILVCRDRFKASGLTEDFYSDKWEHLDVKRPNHANGEDIPKPAELEEMLELSRKLSKDIPFVRTDFYTINHKVYFGEITFFPASGFEAFIPASFDEEMGDWIKIPVSEWGGVVFVKDSMYVFVQTVQASKQGLKDYKFFCFNGKVKCFKVDFDRFTEHRANYYDVECNLLPFGEVMCPPKPEKEMSLPDEIPQMIELAEKLAKDMPFVRIDFYNVNHRIYFGEITFFPASGFGKFIPEEWDEKLGKLIDLTAIKRSI